MVRKELLGHMRARVLVLLSFIIFSCNNDKKQEPIQVESRQSETTAVSKKPVLLPFEADSAYSFVKAQVDFGPRAPGSKAHAKCAVYMASKLKAYGLSTETQIGQATTFDGKSFQLKNVIGKYKPELKKRILLCAHWDSRPFADQDEKDRDKPIDGANDGASGVGVLLEVARQLNITKPDIGVDIIFFDLEDYGQVDSPMEVNRKQDTWCLGTQYWAKNFDKNNKPEFGILLDMVGAANAVFPREGTSTYFAPQIVDKVWSIAAQLGFQSYFINAATGQTTDDHLYINQIAGIPCIDIVHFDPQTSDYPEHHHKHSDNISVIEKSTLKVVGQTLLAVINSEI